MSYIGRDGGDEGSDAGNGKPDDSADSMRSTGYRAGSRISSSVSLAQSLALAGQLGFSIACPMVAFIAGGVWLDGKLNTRPLLMFVGMLASSVASVASLNLRRIHFV